MWIEQPQAQMHECWPLAGADMPGEAARRLVGCDYIRSIDFLGIDASAPGPLHKRAGPLDLRGCGDGPAVIFNYHQDRKSMHRRLTKQHMEIVGCRAAVTSGCEDQFRLLMPLEREANTPGERCQPGHFTKAGQDTMAPTAVMGGHITTGAHGTSNP